MTSHLYRNHEVFSFKKPSSCAVVHPQFDREIIKDDGKKIKQYIVHFFDKRSC